MTQAQLTVLAGPTAVGKGTVVAALRERYPHLLVSVSATTRHPRPGEVNGVHYYFVSPEEFDSMIEGGEMLEWTPFTSPGRGWRVVAETDTNRCG